MDQLIRGATELNSILTPITESTGLECIMASLHSLREGIPQKERHSSALPKPLPFLTVTHSCTSQLIGIPKSLSNQIPTMPQPMYKSLALVPGILLNPDDGTDMMP
jgi:hypothetical protein